MPDYRRIAIATMMGAILGGFCIIGVGTRISGGIEGNIIFLIGMWYNRVIMGLLIGFAGDMMIIKSEQEKNLVNSVLRGLLFGILVSSAIFLSTEFRDFPALLAGFVYGPIIDLVATVTEK
ncbi:MAG: hypothetical protein EAX95_07325 [Candidatus Thorarchaeota archaeon]|nr:hypothetical protein [Candidatus Thorarchaeota archaeon]